LLPKESSFDDVLRTIRETDSPRPSTVLSQNEKLADVAAARQTRPRDLPRQLRGELDWIVLKCLEKDRERRYQSPEDLARDLENHLSDRPIVARPPSLWRGMWKYARRHRVRAALWALASAAVLFVCFAAIFLWYDGKVRQFQSRQRQLQLDSRMAQYESNAAQLDEHIAKAKEQVRLANEQARRENFGRNVALRQLADIARLYLGEIDREQDTLTEDETTRLHQLLPIYLGLAKTAPNQEVPPTVQAAGLSGAGRVRLLLGETKQAETELRQAAVLWEKLVTDYPTLTEFRYQYAACLFDLGQICRASQREAEAIEHYERAQRLLSKSMVGLMAKPAARSELRQTLVALRAVSEQQGDAARLEAAQTALNKLEAMPELKVQFHLPEQKVRLQLRPPPPSTGEEKARP
jgi:tetratricopeptide (TPR) repeat protein